MKIKKYGDYMFQGKNNIRIKALCLFEDNGYIFVSESFDCVKKDFYYRPAGGTTEFGEYTIDTVIREIKEELNTEIINIKLATVLENIFTCDGFKGHEIDFIYSADFKDRKFYEKKEYEIIESDNKKIKGVWMKIIDFINNKYRLVPEELINYYKK